MRYLYANNSDPKRVINVTGANGLGFPVWPGETFVTHIDYTALVTAAPTGPLAGLERVGAWTPPNPILRVDSVSGAANTPIEIPIDAEARSFIIINKSNADIEVAWYNSEAAHKDIISAHSQLQKVRHTRRHGDVLYLIPFSTVPEGPGRCTVIQYRGTEALDRKELYSEDAAIRLAAQDLEFSVSPATLDTDIDDQNAHTVQVIAYDIAGATHAETGAGDIPISIISALYDEPWEEDVTLGTNDNAAAIATKIETALKGTGAPCNVGTGDFTVARATAKLTITANLPAANDTTLELTIGEFVPDDENEPPATEIEATEDEADAVAGVAYYTRQVQVDIQTTGGQRATWFNGVVPITIGETTAGSGTAHIPTLNPVMNRGTMTITVTLKGAWANTDTNTLTVTAKVIGDQTVGAKTSVETSEVAE